MKTKIKIGSRNVDLVEARKEELTYYLQNLNGKQKNGLIIELIHMIRGVN